MAVTMPYLQYIAVVLAVVSGVRALLLRDYKRWKFWK